MGTRSTIKFIEKYDDNEQELVNIYQQYDGYIDGVGKDLAKWLLSKKLVNGFSLGMSMEDGYANGVGCLAAQFIKDNKTEIGGLYIDHIESTEDYNYKVIIDEGKINGKTNIDDITTIIVTNWDDVKPIFRGKPSELLKFTEDE